MMNLYPKRKIITLSSSQGELETIQTTITNEVLNQVDKRNLGFFDYRLRIPVGTDKYD